MFSSVILSIIPFSKVQRFSLSLVLSGSLMVLVKLSYKVCVCVCFLFLILFASIFTLFHNSCFHVFFPQLLGQVRGKKLNRDASLVIARGTNIKEGVSKGF